MPVAHAGRSMPDCKNSMKVVVVVAILTLTGCTSLQDVGLSSQELQARIRAGELVEAGDRVALRTADGRDFVMKVVEVNRESLRGDAAEVLIDDIVMLRVERIDPMRSAGAAAGGAVIVYVAGAVIAFLSLIDSI